MALEKESQEQVHDIITSYGENFLVSLHPLTNIESITFFNYEPRFHGVFSRANLTWIKDGAYVIILNDKQSKGTHWVSLFIDRNTAVYFSSVGVGYIMQEVLRKIKDRPTTHNILKKQDDDSIMCGFYCITFVEYMLAEITT